MFSIIEVSYYLCPQFSLIFFGQANPNSFKWHVFLCFQYVSSNVKAMRPGSQNTTWCLTFSFRRRVAQDSTTPKQLLQALRFSEQAGGYFFHEKMDPSPFFGRRGVQLVAMVVHNLPWFNLSKITCRGGSFGEGHFTNISHDDCCIPPCGSQGQPTFFIVAGWFGSKNRCSLLGFLRCLKRVEPRNP